MHSRSTATRCLAGTRCNSSYRLQLQRPSRHSLPDPLQFQVQPLHRSQHQHQKLEQVVQRADNSKHLPLQ